MLLLKNLSRHLKISTNNVQVQILLIVSLSIVVFGIPQHEPEKPFRTSVSSHIVFNEDSLQDDLILTQNTQHHDSPEHGHGQQHGAATIHQGEGNLTELDHCPNRANNLIGNYIKQLRCEPRPLTVQLKPPGPNYDLVPSVASVNRCGGFCRSSTSCLPTKMSTKEILVHQIDKARAGSIVQSCAIVKLEQHDECKCSCEVKPHHCTSKQRYDAGSCSCICINMEERLECDTNTGRVRRNIFFLPRISEPSELQIPLKLWNPSTCSCSCAVDSRDGNNNCPNDLMWIPKLCRCVRVPLTPDSRFGNDDVLNEIEDRSIDELENMI